ncbi:hypothetical protein P4261_28050 [Bacillus thuringiensis]|nr:hypothetical protein [Bacillus thuringiensis]MED2829735.1 hypothetical protein [Bacillus thuringiensis]MED2856404.1 hypothetical protein [Bacillus thuringiensis]MED2863791.1 hypothetical protein [Bacillus thuringiensis]
MIKGQPKIGDKVVIRWGDPKMRGRYDLDICEIVTDGKRVYLRGYSAITGNVMRAFKAARHKTVESLFTSMGYYMHDGTIKSFHVRRKTNDRMARKFDRSDRDDTAFAYLNIKRKYK